ncbi:MAG: sulfurtransferase-like selenium metabolism protein YedF [Bacteroidetes bacterium]|nr:MAG: sulfurtransferase-like selenium metabolism protein YedF [Bacteroidota bacterium]RLD94241.1 MAG: sulfurtransferase-like selenium metabolism protein YedF [Bacteroidota bacterium]RLD96380.1 MAG: sulfurtransferase-like selenium metabolism protein YedF [Bacteroidota bacterium]
MKTLDTKGLKCPQPLIMLKEALLDLKSGEEIRVETDNDTSLKNLLSYLKDQGVEPEVSSAGTVHTLVAPKPDQDIASSNAAIYCTTDLPISYVVCIKGELMGDGDPELGRLLMETFMDNLKLQEQLPTHVVLYNGGVKLAMKDSPVCNSLTELEELGTRIMLCGTCIDHYGLQFDIGVGMISNMVVITETLAAAGHVVTP